MILTFELNRDIDGEIRTEKVVFTSFFLLVLFEHNVWKYRSAMSGKNSAQNDQVEKKCFKLNRRRRKVIIASRKTNKQTNEIWNKKKSNKKSNKGLNKNVNFIYFHCDDIVDFRDGQKIIAAASGIHQKFFESAVFKYISWQFQVFIHFRTVRADSPWHQGQHSVKNVEIHVENDTINKQIA